MIIHRAKAFFGLAAAALCLGSAAVAAQPLEAAIAIESEVTGGYDPGYETGYMALGGGLAKAIVQRTAAKAADAHRPPRRSQQAGGTGRSTDDGSPIKYIAQALDNSGLNIISLTYTPPPPVN